MELDVHVLKMEYTPHDVVSKCVSSINAAAEHAGYPVHVHVIDGVYGNLGEARRRGYSLGTAPYVTHVDDDDFVDVDAFSVLAPLLREGATAITTGERVHVAGQSRDCPDARHHLAVFSREVLSRSDYSTFKYFPDQRLLSQVTPAHIYRCVYNHVIHSSGSRRCRADNKPEADLELSRIKDKRLAHWETASYHTLASIIDEELRHG